MEYIVLAGGLGTRLRSSIGDHPKCMASVNGLPFLHYVLDYLESQRCHRVVLSLGHKHEEVTGWVEKETRPFIIDYVIEQEPLGTGGGMQLALAECREENVAVLNGDTMFRIDMAGLLDFHIANQAETTLALKEMYKFERYGSVTVDERGHILSFEEKRFIEQGLINGGVYIINRPAFLKKGLPEKFSFEKDYLEQWVAEKKSFGKIHTDYFIDIGIPEDYERAQTDFAAH